MDYTGKKCPICSEKFKADDDIVVCPKCGAPYHRSCYEKEDVFSLTCIEAMRLGKTKKMILKVSRKTLKPRNADFAVI